MQINCLPGIKKHPLSHVDVLKYFSVDNLH